MLPFRDHNPSAQKPYVTYALIAVNILVFLSYVPILTNEAALSSLFDKWALVPAEISAGVEYHTAFTSMFMHAGFMHLAGNMLFLWIFGDNVEDAMGHIPYLIFYLASGLGADAFHWFSDAESLIPTVGASGAIAGVMGAYLLLYPKARVDVFLMLFVIFKKITMPAFIVLGGWMIMQVVSGVGTSGSEGGGVAYWAHFGGFIVGILLAVPVWLKLGATNFWHSYDFSPPNKPTDWLNA